MLRQTATSKTWLQDEEYAYPNGGQTRKGMAYYPDGKIRRVYGGIADTFFSIPAHGTLHGRYVAGYLRMRDDCELQFRLDQKYR